MKLKRNYIVVGSAVLVGLTLIVSGTGKVPGQTEFMWALLKSFWTPTVSYFISYILPWVEIGLGILLFAGMLPRIAAVACIPLIGGFLANNVWAVIQGLDVFPECSSCFGIWEEYIGSLSPVGAIVLDVVMLILVSLVMWLHRENFLSFRPWFMRRKWEQVSPNQIPQKARIG